MPQKPGQSLDKSETVSEVQHDAISRRIINQFSKYTERAGPGEAVERSANHRASSWDLFVPGSLSFRGLSAGQIKARLSQALSMPSLAFPSSITYYADPVVLALYLASSFYDPTNDKTKKTAEMAELKVGDAFPAGVTFSYIPYTPEAGEITSCGIPINYDASKEWANKKVVLFSVPGAFTPGCSAKHLPGYIENLSTLKSKGVDVVATIAYNDAFVMSAWGKANGIKDDSLLFLSDPGTEFSKKLGWTLGERTARYALVIDNGKIVYAEKEPGREVTVSSAEAVLAKL